MKKNIMMILALSLVRCCIGCSANNSQTVEEATESAHLDVLEGYDSIEVLDVMEISHSWDDTSYNVSLYRYSEYGYHGILLVHDGGFAIKVNGWDLDDEMMDEYGYDDAIWLKDIAYHEGDCDECWMKIEPTADDFFVLIKLHSIQKNPADDYELFDNAKAVKDSEEEREKIVYCGKMRELAPGRMIQEKVEVEAALYINDGIIGTDVLVESGESHFTLYAWWMENVMNDEVMFIRSVNDPDGRAIEVYVDERGILTLTTEAKFRP